MKIYVFVTFNIHYMGGGENYLSGKTKYLEDNGWEVKVLFSGNRHKKCAFSSLQKYVGGGFWLLGRNPDEVSTKLVRTVLRRIINYIGAQSNDRVVVESSEDTLHLWGELIAQNLGAKHICLNCNEIFRYPWIDYTKHVDFYKFKYARHELYGIRENSIHDLLLGYEDVPVCEGLCFVAEPPEPVQDVQDARIRRIRRSDYTIAYISRTNKGYFPNVCAGVKLFAKNVYPSAVQFVIVGELRGEKGRVKQMQKDTKNLSVVAMGNMIPIPKSLFKNVDAVIAGAGCANFSSRYGVPVIVANPKTLHANGVLCYDTVDPLWGNPKMESTFDEALNRVLIDKEYLHQKYQAVPTARAEMEYSKQLALFEDGRPLEYFDVLGEDHSTALNTFKGWVETYFPVIKNIKAYFYKRRH